MEGFRALPSVDQFLNGSEGAALIARHGRQATREARNGQIIVARLGDDVTVKRLRRTATAVELLPENPDYPVIVVQPGEPFEIEGLAVGLIRNTMLM